MPPFQPAIAPPFIGVADGPRLRKAMDRGLQSRPLRMRYHPQTTRSAGPSDRPDHRRSVVFIRAVPASLIGATPRRIRRIAMGLAFFPPQAETAHPFRFVPRLRGSPLKRARRGRGVSDGACAPSCGSSPVLRLSPDCFRPYRPRVRAPPCRGERAVPARTVGVDRLYARLQVRHR
jgi:hypothetical protein